MPLYNLIALFLILLTIVVIVYLKNFKCKHRWKFVEQRNLQNSEGKKIKTNNVSICIHCGCYKNTDVTAR